MKLMCEMEEVLLIPTLLQHLSTILELPNLDFEPAATEASRTAPINGLDLHAHHRYPLISRHHPPSPYHRRKAIRIVSVYDCGR